MGHLKNDGLTFMQKKGLYGTHMDQN